MEGYNRSYHRSIKMTPNQVNQVNSSSVWKTPSYGDKKGKLRLQKPQLKVGDSVRLNEKFKQFKKSYLPGWTEEVDVEQDRSIGGQSETDEFDESVPVSIQLV